jgi:hypothetical protein
MLIQINAAGRNMSVLLAPINSAEIIGDAEATQSRGYATNILIANKRIAPA